MKNRDSKEIIRLEKLKHIEDPNEFIRMIQEWAVEDAAMLGVELFPLPRDSAGDIVQGFVGAWLVTCGEFPIKSKDDVVRSIDYMIEMLREWQGYLQSDNTQMDKNLLRCLRMATGKLVGESYWSEEV